MTRVLPSARFARFARRLNRSESPGTLTAVVLVALIAPALTQCEAWDDGPPPATAANGGQPPPAPLPPGPPIPPGGASDPSIAAGGGTGATDESAPPPAGDDQKYASGEYAIGTDSDAYADNDPAALSDFHAPLDPHGTWNDDPTYGTVWVPASSEVGPDFTPYVSSGHWAYDDDYVWVSDYSWGWAPFHYGRWVFIDGRGWAWIPGREYRGAWVNWEVDGGYSYLGWAPMGPAFVWFGGVPVAYGGYWGPRWSYVPRGEVFAPRVAARVVVGPSAVAIAGRMRPFSVQGHLGPPPAKFGYAPAQIPRVSGAAAVSVSRAQQFSRPSTARPLGASAPSRVESRPPIGAAQGRGPLVEGPRSTASPSTHAYAPSVTSGPRSVAPGGGADVSRVQSAPARAPSASPAGHPGGGFHGGGGGGGHHR